MLGSSKIYKDPTRLLPNEVAKLIRWLSPPLKVLLSLSNVKYPNPTSNKICNLLLISVNNRLAVAASDVDNPAFFDVELPDSPIFKSPNHCFSSMMDLRVKSVIDAPPTFT